MEVITMESGFRIFCLSQITLLILLSLKVTRASLSARLFTGFLLGCLAYLSIPLLTPAPSFIWLIPLIIVASGLPFFFWLFAESIFREGFQLRIWHGLPYTTFLGLNLFFTWDALTPGDFLLGPWVWIPRIFVFVFVALALRAVLSDWRSDLVEQRRRFRLGFVIIVALQIVMVATIETIHGIYPGGSIPQLDYFNAVYTALLSLMVNFYLLTPQGGFLSPPSREQTPSLNPTYDRRIVTKLEAIMAEQKLYLAEGLTIGKLAKQIEIPEYKLRQAINQGLKFKNFNSYINSLRAKAAAEKLLSHPSKKVLDVALEVGYRSLAPFNKSFRDHIGMTPSTFRRQELAKTRVNPLQNSSILRGEGESIL